MRRSYVLATIGLIGLVALALFSWLHRGESASTEETQRVAPAEETAPAAAATPTLEYERREVDALAPRASDATDLLRALEEIAALDLGDRTASEPVLRPWLYDPSQAREALRLLMDGGLKTDPDRLSKGEIGAIRLVWLAVGAYADASFRAELEEAGQRIDPRAFDEEVLRGLASIQEPAATTLTSVLAGLRSGDEQVIGRSYVELLRVLIASYPDREALYSIFLQRMGEDEPLEFDLQFLGLDEDPAVLKARLVASFEKADAAQALQLLQWIEDAYGRADPELQLQLAQAVAAAAPVSRAASFLSERASQFMYSQFFVLGMRDGAQEALGRQYNDLLVTGAKGDARKMIVSGLAGSGFDVLAGIAETDPSEQVRGQALLTAMAAPDFRASASFLQRLRDGHAALGTPTGIPPYATISVAEGLLRHATRDGNGELADATVQLLRELAADPKVPAYQKKAIPDLVRDRIPEAEWEALSAAVGGST